MGTDGSSRPDTGFLSPKLLPVPSAGQGAILKQNVVLKQIFKTTVQYSMNIAIMM